jgi:hypothetical protein
MSKAGAQRYSGISEEESRPANHRMKLTGRGRRLATTTHRQTAPGIGLPSAPRPCSLCGVVSWHPANYNNCGGNGDSRSALRASSSPAVPFLPSTLRVVVRRLPAAGARPPSWGRAGPLRRVCVPDPQRRSPKPPPRRPCPPGPPAPPRTPGDAPDKPRGRRFDCQLTTA